MALKMAHLRLTSVLLLGVAVMVLGSRPARADDASEQLRRQVEAMRESAGERVKVADPNRLKKVERNARSWVDAAAPSPLPQPPPDGQRFERKSTHIKMEGGVPFPEPSEVVLAPRPTATPTVPSQEETLSPPIWKRPTRCDGQGQNVTTFKWAKDLKSETILLDILYLHEDLVPNDSSEVFGLETKLNPYGPKSGDRVYSDMEVDDVKCLPYRIRVTSKAQYLDYGNNALKNYDKAPSGKGEYHPWILQKVFNTK